MSAGIDVTLTQSGSSWVATLYAVTGVAPSTATSPDPATALEAAREAALQAVYTAAPGQGISIGPMELVILDYALRNATSLSLYALQNPVPAPALIDPYGFGIDVSTFTGPSGLDLDPTFTIIYGRQAVGEAVARRLLCAPGSLLESPGDGLNVRAWLNKGWAPSQLRTAAGDVEAECLKDERVQDASASVVLVGDTLTISVSLVTAAGPFALVLTVQALAVSLQILDQS